MIAKPVPSFLDGSAGRLFSLYHPPAGGTARRGMLYVPPFAEEMNRARRMAALQARALAAAGVGVLLLDLYGTGDSAGDFADAGWDQWIDDVNVGLEALRRRGHDRLCLWGLRLGSLLACHVGALAPAGLDRLVLWQPVISGKTMLTQFLRIRVAAAMGEENGESTANARALLTSGQSLEVAGYDLSPALASAIDRARLETLRLPAGLRVDWLDVATEEGAPPTPATERIVAAWGKADVAVHSHTVVGLPFWALQETTTAPALIDKTTDLIAHEPR